MPNDCIVQLHPNGKLKRVFGVFYSKTEAETWLIDNTVGNFGAYDYQVVVLYDKNPSV